MPIRSTYGRHDVDRRTESFVYSPDKCQARKPEAASGQAPRKGESGPTLIPARHRAAGSPSGYVSAFILPKRPPCSPKQKPWSVVKMMAVESMRPMFSTAFSKKPSHVSTMVTSPQ